MGRTSYARLIRISIRFPGRVFSLDGSPVKPGNDGSETERLRQGAPFFRNSGSPLCRNSSFQTFGQAGNLSAANFCTGIRQDRTRKQDKPGKEGGNDEKVVLSRNCFDVRDCGGQFHSPSRPPSAPP